MTRNTRPRVALWRLVAAGCVLGGFLLASDHGTPRAGAADASSSWTVYHGDALGTGDSTTLSAVDTNVRAWTSVPLRGQLYGEPLVADGRVYVATEADMVYALSAGNGHVLWARHVANAVPASLLPCGDIGPDVGVTGTPVIDPARNEIFLVADELVRGAPRHALVGLSLTTGARRLTRWVDLPGSDPKAYLQRTGLNLVDGRIVFGMGGNSGDCSTYHGLVVSVGVAGAAAKFFTVDAAPGDTQGAIWMGGAAPVVDAHGDVWVSSGNGSVTSSSQPYDDSDATLELTPLMHLVQYFAPTSWPSDNAADLDFSTAPVLLANGQVVQAGKSSTIYLLNASHLGGIGSSSATTPSTCGGDIDGGAAFVGLVVYLPCHSGPIAVSVHATPPLLTTLWSANDGSGPPIVAANVVWTIGDDGSLYGLNPATGAVVQQTTVGAESNHFPTPSVGDGLLLVPTANRVIAFHGTPAG